MSDDRDLDRRHAPGSFGKQLPVGVVGASAVAHRDVEVPVWSKGEVPSVVVELWPVDPQQLASACSIDDRSRVAWTGDLPLGKHVLVVRGSPRWQGGREGGRPVVPLGCIRI